MKVVETQMDGMDNMEPKNFLIPPGQERIPVIFSLDRKFITSG